MALARIENQQLIKVKSASNPIFDKHIQEKKPDKKAGKVLSSLVRNDRMTDYEAKKSVDGLNNDTTLKRNSREGRGIVKTDI
jgi:hypothetical protein